MQHNIPWKNSLTVKLTKVKSDNTAKKHLKQIEDLGILIPQKIGKEVLYLNVDLFNLLSES